MDIKKFGLYFLLGIIIALALKFYMIIYAFFPAIATGCVLSYLFNPIYLYLLKIIKRESLAAFAVMAIIFLLLLVPLLVVIFSVQQQINVFFNVHTFTSLKNTVENIDDIIYSTFKISISEQFINAMFEKLITASQSTVAALGPKMIFSITKFILMAFITFFLLYYLLRNSASVIRTFKDYFPISYANCELLLREMGRHTKALIFGQLLVSIVQGTLGGVGFFICGVHSAIMWGLVMVIVAFIPFLGAGLIWFPASIIQLAKGNYYSGIGILLWGIFIVSTIDNIIRPKLTSTLGKIHPVTVLLGVFIGLKEWGFIGLVIGPLMISVLLILIRMFREEYLEE